MRILVDTGFWYALFTARDPYHEDACQKEEWLKNSQLVIPWPTLHETLNTRFSKDGVSVSRFEGYLRRTNCVLLDDLPYRDKALEAMIAQAKRGFEQVSLVDMVIRLMLEDTNVQVNGLVTFNARDFQGVCLARQIEIV